MKGNQDADDVREMIGIVKGIWRRKHCLRNPSLFVLPLRDDK
jgi:hypothetical protein